MLKKCIDIALSLNGPLTRPNSCREKIKAYLTFPFGLSSSRQMCRKSGLVLDCDLVVTIDPLLVSRTDHESTRSGLVAFKSVQLRPDANCTTR